MKKPARNNKKTVKKQSKVMHVLKTCWGFMSKITVFCINIVKKCFSYIKNLAFWKKSAGWLKNIKNKIQKTKAWKKISGFFTKLFSKMKLWHKITLAVLGILITLGLIAWVFVGNGSTKPVFTMNISSPSAVSFQDSNYMNLVANSEDDYSDAPATVSLPEPNNERELSSVQPLHISYNLYSGEYSPALKMNLTASDIEKYAKITPFIKGTWTTDGYNSLAFHPARDWPADKKFTVKLNKKLFNYDVKIKSYSGSFETEKLKGYVKSFDVYPELTKQKSMVAVGVISFNYPIDTKNFEENVALRVGGNKVNTTIKFDSFNRTAFITSESIAVKNSPQRVSLNISSIMTAQGDAKSASIETARATIESADNFFKLLDINTAVVDNQKGEPEQLVLLNFTSQAKNVKWTDYVNVYLLPQKKDQDKSGSHRWETDEITDEILSASKKLPIKHIDFANPAGVYKYAFSYDVLEKETRYIYISIKPGLVSDIGFPLKNSYDNIMPVPYPEKEVKIVGSGNILSMSGGQQLALVSRGGAEAAHVNLYKVKSSELNHLISQTYNIMSEVEFKGYSFGPEDISMVFSKKIPFANTSLKAVNYAAVDLGEYLNKTNDRTGIFIVQVGATENSADNASKKLILLTDLGMIRKVHMDDSSSVFVSSLANGGAVSGAKVSVLGRNGNPIWTSETNWSGRVDVPKFSYNEYRREKEPVAYVVTKGNDISFMPYQNNYDQQVEFSKFDIEGAYASEYNPVSAYLFSDRGIYRPGEKLIVGGIVKDRTFKSLSGVPAQFVLIDARGKTIMEKTFSLSADGMFDMEYRLSGTAPIGDYTARVFSLNDENKTHYVLGETTLRVEEFVPDTLKISASINNAKTKGWIKPTDIKATVSLRNLFGTPATDRRISSRAVMTPAEFTFTEFKDYQFTTNYISGTGLSKKSSVMAETVHQDLPDTKTDKEGVAEIDVKFENNINPGTYVLSFSAEGFEGDSGRSVKAATGTKVSDAEYLIGYKSSASLSYINKGAKRSVNFIAISDNVEKRAVEKLNFRIVKKQNLISLIQDYSGYYKYQTITREKVIKTSEINVSKSGLNLDLDTKNSGDYYAQITDGAGKVLAHIEYFVAGAENIALQSDQKAELKVKLSKAEYSPGSEIEVNITSPYIGTGLITIEKEKVYAHRWFHTNTTSSVQRITLPDDFEGSGYINVSFVRDINSRDVFTTPYTYAVVPFAVDKSKREITIDLKTPDVVRDKKLNVRYTTNKSGRIMIFAVNEGILQVAKYQTPKPIGFFFKKSALQVSTYQILSLLLPEYKILRDFAKTGGGDYDELADMEVLSKNITNPFARVVDEPVAFYSGIIDAIAGQTGSLTFDIPDHFNGAVRIYAVAANSGALGSGSTESKIQSPVIISATSPLMATPGDEFTVNAVISNMTDNSGPKATVTSSVSTSGNLEVVGAKNTKLDIPEKTEKLWKFMIRAKEGLGNATIEISANVLGPDGKLLSKNSSKSTLSVRPVSLFSTNVITKYETDKKITIKDFQIDQYKEFGSKELFISNHSFVLIKPLFEYLNNYQYSCSEQTVSKALPYALFPSETFLGIDNKKSAEKVQNAINVLKNRQNDNGSFGLWDSGYSYSESRNNAADASAAYVTSYAVQFLTIAKENGFNVPSNMLSKSVDFLRTYSGKNVRNDFDAETKAFAIYLVSKNGYVTTTYIEGFEEYANKNMKNWQSELPGAYIAASYKLLKQNDKANSLIKKYKVSDNSKFLYRHDYNNNIVNDAVYVYLVNNHFDRDISNDKLIKVLDGIQEYITRGYYSSFTSAASIMALSGIKKDSGSMGDTISVIGYAGKNKINLHPADSKSRDIFQTSIADDISKLEISCDDCGRDKGVFYTLIQQGFAKKSKSQNKGIEVIREYYNKDGDRVTSATVGDELTVKIFARATEGSAYIDNVVIADLLPSGFSIIPDSVSGSYEFHEPREDRLIVYKTISKSVSEIEYKVKVTASGKFTIPGIQAASMYNPQVMGAAKSGSFVVENAKME